MTPKQALEALKTAKTNKVKLAITDIDGVLRGKVVNIEKFQSIAERVFYRDWETAIIVTGKQIGRAHV